MTWRNARPLMVGPTLPSTQHVGGCVHLVARWYVYDCSELGLCVCPPEFWRGRRNPKNWMVEKIMPMFNCFLLKSHDIRSRIFSQVHISSDKNVFDPVWNLFLVNSSSIARMFCSVSWQFAWAASQRPTPGLETQGWIQPYICLKRFEEFLKLDDSLLINMMAHLIYN